MAGQPGPYTGQAGNKPTTEGTTPAQKAMQAGFKGLALATIIAIDAAGGYAMKQADYNAAYLKTKGGTDFNSYGGGWPDFKSTSCSNAPGYLAYILPIAKANSVSVTSGMNSLAGCAQNQNIPGGNLINNATDLLNGGVDWQRLATGLFGGILVLIGLMMGVKQLTGVPITGVPGKFGKVLALK